MFIHYLITRFNVKISEHGPERMNSPVIDDRWLHQRIELFLTYCVPSVLNQKNKQFHWLIYLDVDTPQFVLNKIEYLKHLDRGIVFFFVADFNQMLNHIRKEFEKSKLPYIISSRLDNDDMVGDQFIQCIQDAFIPQPNTMININAGYVYHAGNKVLTKWRNKYTNQFSSIIEAKSTGHFITIYGFPHWKPPFQSQTQNVLDIPCWMEMVHPDNNRPRTSLGIPIFFTNSIQNFPPVMRALKISLSQTILYGLRWFPSVILRRLRSFAGQK